MRKGKHGVKLVGASSDHHIEEVKDVEDGIQEVASTERTPPSLTEDTSRDNGTYEEKIVSQVVDRFVFMAKQELLNHLRAVMERPQPYEAPTGSRQNQVTSTLTSSYSSSSNQNDGGTSKRHREGGKDPGDGDGGSDGDDEDDDRRRGKKPRSNDRNSPRKRLRCPFYLNNPIKYGTYQACSSGMGFEDMGRLR